MDATYAQALTGAKQPSQKQDQRKQGANGTGSPSESKMTIKHGSEVYKDIQPTRIAASRNEEHSVCLVTECHGTPLDHPQERKRFIHKVTLRKPKDKSQDAQDIYRRLQRAFPAIYKQITTKQVCHILNQLLYAPQESIPGDSQGDMKRLYEQYGDLQHVPPEKLKQAKQHMEQGFQVNVVKPGDNEWKYDKRIDFEASEENEWDETTDTDASARDKDDSQASIGADQENHEGSLETPADQGQPTESSATSTNKQVSTEQDGHNKAEEDDDTGEENDADDYSDSFEDDDDEGDEDDQPKQSETTAPKPKVNAVTTKEKEEDAEGAESVESDIEEDADLLDSDEDEDSGSVDADEFY